MRRYVAFVLVGLLLFGIGYAFGWNNRVKSDRWVDVVPPVVIMLDTFPSKVQVLIDDMKAIDAMIREPMKRGVRVPDGVSFKKIGYIDMRNGEAITLFWPVGAFDVGDGIHETNLSELERTIKSALDRASFSFRTQDAR